MLHVRVGPLRYRRRIHRRSLCLDGGLWVGKSGLMTEMNLLARHRAVMPAWLTLYYEEPIEIVRGQGRRVFDVNGNAYLDLFAGILTNAVGYDIEEISEAVRAQIA